jgi:hypothetical protein
MIGRASVCRILLMFLLLFVSAPARAAILPHDSVQRLCMKSQLIVAGVDLSDGTVRVEHVYYSAASAPRELSIIKVPKLPGLDRLLPGGKDAPMDTKRVFLFLLGSVGGNWEPIHTIGAGSQGVFWWDEKACYGYIQFMNPGGYMLFSSGQNPLRRVPAGPDAMRKEITAGLEFRTEWDAIGAIADRAERARRMAAFLLPRTAPRVDEGSLDLRKDLANLGPDAVPAVVALIEKAREDDNLDTAVLILMDIGERQPEAIRQAVPALLRLLEHPGKTTFTYILEPLRAAGDTRAIEPIRALLKHESLSVRAKAALALAAMKDRESFNAIVALFGNPPDAKGMDVLDADDVFRALFILDSAKARPILREVMAVPGNEELRRFSGAYFETWPR